MNTSYYIVNSASFHIQEVNDDGWFSNPIKKFGPDNFLMSSLVSFGGCHSKTSWSSNTNYYCKFFVYGKQSSFSIKGWIFPSELSNCTDSSSRVGNIYNEFAFDCTTPEGVAIRVSAKVNVPFLYGVMLVIKTLIALNYNQILEYSYVIDGKRYIHFSSYYLPSNKYFPI